MTEAMPFLQKYDITFLRPPPIVRRTLADEKFTVLPQQGGDDLRHTAASFLESTN